MNAQPNCNDWEGFKSMATKPGMPTKNRNGASPIPPGAATVTEFNPHGPAVKFDNEKAGVHLLPFDALEAIVKVYDFGAVKYAARNWEKGMAWSRLFGACMRHMWAWFRGQDKDPETGLSHLDHAAFCILGLRAYELRKIGDDDRPKL